MTDLPGIETPHAAGAGDLLNALGVSADRGLSGDAAGRRLRQHGPNAITMAEPASALALLQNQFRSPVVWLLGAAAALAFAFGEIIEGAAIVAVLAINTLIGFVTEIRAVRSIEALRALGQRMVRVRRDGQAGMIRAEDLVPGDIVLVEGGDAVSADLRIIEASHLGVDESALTGESVPVDKDTRPVPQAARITERGCMLFKGTLVVRGSATAVVVGTGLDTELGRISRLVVQAAPEHSPLELRLASLSGQLIRVVAVLTVALAVLGIWSGRDAFLMVEAAIALAVAAIPEGLPIVATLALARGMWRMAQRNALVERLSAVETLGGTTVILTDKTGTLTENRMTVRRLWLGSGVWEMDGSAPDGPAAEAAAGHLLRVAVLCNDATLGNGQAGGSGDPMEIALLQAGAGAGITRQGLAPAWPLVRKHAFETGRNMMATVHAAEGRFFVAVKGAPESVLAVADSSRSDTGTVPMTAALRDEWAGRAADLAAQGLRVIACASKSAPDAGARPYQDLTFLGLIGLEDPARPDVPDAIRACRRAGIRVVMVTGDHAATAQSIARAVGIQADAAAVVEGDRIAALIAGPPENLRAAGIFARVSPAEKIALVRAYQQAGEIVAMTGDGVNDAPALRQADIGVAMGQRGTDVAREAADMILLDDAFASIVGAIREGRIIFDNIRRFAAYLLACNLTEVLVVGLAVMAMLPLPILPLQILYLNLVTDIFPAFALALGDGERDILERRPRDPREKILGRRQWAVIALHGAVMTAAAFFALGWALAEGLEGRAMVTTTFLTVGFAQLWHVFNMRALHSGIWRNEVTRNPWVWGALVLCAGLLALPSYWGPGAEVLQLVPPDAAMWGIILTSSLGALVVIQLAMIIIAALRRRGPGRAHSSRHFAP